MTNMPEAKLAREAEMCYATVAMVTDYDCWHPQHDDVTVEMIVKTLLANADNARSLVKQTAPKVARLKGVCPYGCQTALEHALITAPDARDPEMVKRLDAVAGRVLSRSNIQTRNP
jgi:5'-methylthioadenosine phosphorylase